MVPVHAGRTIQEPLLRAIVRDANLSVIDFVALLSDPKLLAVKSIKRHKKRTKMAQKGHKKGTDDFSDVIRSAIGRPPRHSLAGRSKSMQEHRAGTLGSRPSEV